jgi:hypothetical protein
VTADDVIRSALRAESAPWPIETEGLETQILDAAADHGVLALLAAAPGTVSWPDSVRTALMQAVRIEAAAEAIRERELRQLLDELGRAAIRPLLMKGAQVAYTHYRHPWQRPRLDTDLIVAPADRYRADAVLRALGYRPGTDFGGELVSHQFQYERRNRYGLTDNVDLHWKMSNPHVFADAFSFEELDGQAIRVPALGANARGLSDAHALILACVHRVAHHRNSDRLIWLYDIHLLASAIGPRDWEACVDLISIKRLRSICSSGLARAQACFGTTVPQTWLDPLQAVSPESEPAAAFLHADRTKLDILRSDLQALPGWRSKLTIIREHLFPPAAYIRRAYGVTNPAVLPLAYAFRIAKGVGKWRRP